MDRLGFIGRIMLILMCALFALVLLTIGLNRWQRTAVDAPARPTLLDHASAIVAIVRRTPSNEYALLVQALSGTGFRVTITDSAPTSSDELVRAPWFEKRLKDKLGEPPAEIEAYRAGYAGRQAFLSGRGGRIARVVASLPAGQFLVIEAPGRANILPARILGLPPGFWVGILGFGVAGLALLAALREARPLRQLTRSVSGFDGAHPEAPVPELGAPDIRGLVRAINGMQARIATLLQERSFLIGAISHDLKTYLTRLRLRAEAVEDQDRRDRMVRDLDEMGDLLDTSLAFARGTTVSQQRRRFDMADLIAVEVAERAASGAPVRLIEDDGKPILVEGDPVALRRVIANLIENAIKFGRSSVEIRIEQEPEICRVLVDDDGPGIREEDCATIFNPFYRADASRSREHGGTGLGLSIAKQIIDAHGGMITACRSALGGACLDVRLPLDSHG